MDAELTGVLGNIAVLCEGPMASAYAMACNELLNDVARDPQSDPTVTQALVEFCEAHQPPNHHALPKVVQSAKADLRGRLATYLLRKS